MKNTLNVQAESLTEKYLGMPTDVGRSVNGTFKFLKDSVEKSARLDSYAIVDGRKGGTH